jgi:hypothetical protein
VLELGRGVCFASNLLFTLKKHGTFGTFGTLLIIQALTHKFFWNIVGTFGTLLRVLPTPLLYNEFINNSYP